MTKSDTIKLSSLYENFNAPARAGTSVDSFVRALFQLKPVFDKLEATADRTDYSHTRIRGEAILEKIFVQDDEAQERLQDITDALKIYAHAMRVSDLMDDPSYDQVVECLDGLASHWNF